MKTKLDFIKSLKRYNELNNKYTINQTNVGSTNQDEFTEYLALQNRFSGLDVIGMLLEIIDAADNIYKQASVCENFVISFGGSEIKEFPCNDAAKKYKELRKKEI